MQLCRHIASIYPNVVCHPTIIWDVPALRQKVENGIKFLPSRHCACMEYAAGWQATWDVKINLFVD